MLLYTLVQMVDLLISVITTIVIIQFVLGLLMAFNVVSPRNQIVETIYRSLNALLEPVLGPVRRMLPATGAIDFSPLVLIVALQLLSLLLRGLAMSGY
ncbi:YggT family protein [Novosphingobium sp.]|uniref:YggT family protein n=1 Tax=Novosphingobium sp. TaxID=1874826 RepID=UPI003B5246E4